MTVDDLSQSSRLRSVPAEFTRYTCGVDDLEEYLRSGAEISIMLNLAAERVVGKRLADFERVLDFGCGAGRILSFLPEQRRVTACDVNDPLIEFVRSHLPNVDAYKTNPAPPLPFQASTFDLIYAFSVFSHLDRDSEEAWLEELFRVGAPGCLYLLSVHGDWVIEKTLGEERRRAQAMGFYYRAVHSRHDSVMDFPTNYEASYHTSEYIKTEWSKHFEVVDIVQGDDPARYLFADLAFEPAGTVPLFRPMGQDLVVLRKASS